MKIKIEKIPESQGGGFSASVEGFEFYLLGDGHDPIEALESLISLMRSESAKSLYKACKERKMK
jgi:hypothetical protein